LLIGSGGRNLPKGQYALAFAREQLDRLGIDKDLQKILLGTMSNKLPQSKRLVGKELAVA
jgi:hypothetical protein